MSVRADNDQVIAFRPIRADDDGRLRDHHDGLSPESRYRRFFAVKPHLSNADVRYLVEVDGRDHFALVATLPDADGEPIVGVARFIRIADSPEVAEVAIVVNDAFQGRGMGSELVSRLAQEAVARGVRRFRATMLPDNLAVHRLFESLAAGPVERRRLAGIFEMEFPLPGAARSDDDAPDAALSAAA